MKHWVVSDLLAFVAWRVWWNSKLHTPVLSCHCELCKILNLVKAKVVRSERNEVKVRNELLKKVLKVEALCGRTERSFSCRNQMTPVTAVFTIADGCCCCNGSSLWMEIASSLVWTQSVEKCFYRAQHESRESLFIAIVTNVLRDFDVTWTNCPPNLSISSVKFLRSRIVIMDLSMVNAMTPHEEVTS